MRSVTKQAVREARLKEIKQELLNSEKLKVSGLLSLSFSPFCFASFSMALIGQLFCHSDIL